MTKEEAQALMELAFRNKKPRGVASPVSAAEQRQRVESTLAVLRECAVNYAKEDEKLRALGSKAEPPSAWYIQARLMEISTTLLEVERDAAMCFGDVLVSDRVRFAHQAVGDAITAIETIRAR